jgi:hypothetical protein
MQKDPVHKLVEQRSHPGRRVQSILDSKRHVEKTLLNQNTTLDGSFHLTQAMKSGV